MRFLSLNLRSYRIHRELKVDFASNLTLIGGPNETGKSTLVEALHRVLFLKAKGGTVIHRAMVSHTDGACPEVTLCFEANGACFTLRKVFGSTGSTTLKCEGRVPLSGEEAEAELAALLRLVGSPKPSEVADLWSHLWVWQGSSGSDPTQDATQQRQVLRQRLQAIEGEAFLTSPTDARLAQYFSDQVAVYFNQNGQPAKNGPLGQGLTALASAETAFADASERLRRLHRAIVDFETSSRALVEAEVSERSLVAEGETLAGKLRQLAGLQKRKEEDDRNAEAAVKRYSALELAHRNVLDLVASLERAEAALRPLADEAAKLQAAAERERTAALEAEKLHTSTLAKLRELRAVHDLQASSLENIRATARLANLTARDIEVARQRSRLQTLRDELARLPPVDASALKKLTRLDTQHVQTEAALNAMATGIDVLATEAPVQVGDQSLVAGASLVLTADTELQLNPQTRLRIRPGGGTSLTDARRAEFKARELVQSALTQYGVTDLAAASEVRARRDLIAPSIEELEAMFATTEITTLADRLAAARTEAGARQADMERRAAQSPSIPLATEEEAAQTALDDSKRALAAIEEAESKADRALSSARKQGESARERVELHCDNLSKAREAVTELNSRLQLLRETHGHDADRAARLATALDERDRARVQLAATQQAITDLQPDLLERSRVRLERARDETARTKREADRRSAEAQGALRSDGLEDPVAAVADAESRWRRAKKHHASLEHDARALQLLEERFQAAQRELADRFTRPLVQRISGYLACLFGAETHAVLTHTPDGFEGLALVRGGSTVPFAELSGGTKEQVAAAMRLALAEILAEDFDGCLPLIFDDAFAYADPERVNSLQGMLDLGASRGLQLIILTCNPADYRTLGACTVVLNTPNTAPRAARPVYGVGTPGDADDGGDPEALVGETGSGVTPAEPAVAMRAALPPEKLQAKCEQFIADLGRLGGGAGNMKLRETLGWDEPTYEAVKESLLSSNRIASGRGRGGSVRLAGN